jgi:hypothetical protein
METKVSSLHSQVPVTWPNPEPDQSSLAPRPSTSHNLGDPYETYTLFGQTLYFWMLNLAVREVTTGR